MLRSGGRSGSRCEKPGGPWPTPARQSGTRTETPTVQCGGGSTTRSARRTARGERRSARRTARDERRSARPLARDARLCGRYASAKTTTALVLSSGNPGERGLPRFDTFFHHLAVLAEIETELFLLLGYAERDNQVRHSI